MVSSGSRALFSIVSLASLIGFYMSSIDVVKKFCQDFVKILIRGVRK